MSRLGKKLEEMLSAASFAESGEFDTARELLAGSKQVLLVLTGRETDTKSLTYGLNIAQRTGAGLEVLTTSASQAVAELVAICEARAGEAGAPLKVAKVKGCVKEALLAHMKNRRDIICVVIESTEALETECTREHKHLDSVWEKLGCPLALVSEKS
ncbi:MAG: hypothetical protein C4534_11225 [Gaiellales bacterium]|nr:MAG: hypothetical protein C4534_11225 [Gaiellales bacterium]